MHIPQAHDNKTRNIFIFCTTNGWWGLIVALILAERLYPYRSAFRRLMGQTRRSMKNRPLEMRWKMAWVVTEWNGSMGGYGMELP